MVLYSDKQCKVDSPTSRDESSLDLVNDCNGVGVTVMRERCAALFAITGGFQKIIRRASIMFWMLVSCASKVLREADEEWNSSTECDDDRFKVWWMEQMEEVQI